MEVAKDNSSEIYALWIEQWGSASAQGLRITLFVLIVAFTIVANSAVIYITVIRSKSPSVRNVFLASATVINLFLGLSTYGRFLLYGLHRNRRDLGRPLCLLLCIVEDGSNTAFLLHLFALSWQQLRSLTAPMEAPLRRPTALTVTTLLWVTSFGAWSVYLGVANLGPMICHFASKIITIIVVVVLFALPLAATATINLMILLVIRKISLSYRNIVRTEEQLRRQQRERRASLVLSICSAVFICCWLPMILIWMFTDMVALAVPVWSFYIADLPYYVYPSIHPLLLFTIDLSLRKQLTNLLLCRKQKQIRPLSIHSHTRSTVT